MNRHTLVFVPAFLLTAVSGCGPESPSPTAVSDPTDPSDGSPAAAALTFTQITSGAFHSCGLVGDRKAYRWGLNLDGQIGDGTRMNRSRPRPVSGVLRFTQIAAGTSHTCAVTATNQAYCWGLNDNGQLGTRVSAPCSRRASFGARGSFGRSARASATAAP